MAKAKTKPVTKRKVKKTVTKAKRNSRLAGRTSKTGVCHTWLLAFENKKICTAAACTAYMKKEFPGRNSKIFDYPNTVVTRANKGLLDRKKHNFKKYNSKES